MDVGLVLKSPVVPEVIALLQFDPAVGSNPYQKPADFKLVIKVWDDASFLCNFYWSV
jgi:hypothetical protein